MTTIVERGRLLPDTCLHFDTFATTDHVGPLEYCADCSQLSTTTTGRNQRTNRAVGPCVASGMRSSSGAASWRSSRCSSLSHRLVVGMTDPIERIRYDDPDAPKLFDPLADPADAWDRARDNRIADQLEGR
ncbi:hypothetical protein GS438_26135 [Rhodococcus hoagii]|nr:hypothetical protein [Prescottella equi]